MCPKFQFKIKWDINLGKTPQVGFNQFGVIVFLVIILFIFLLKLVQFSFSFFCLFYLS